ncbi:hypothetical protein B9Z19DRAFT_1090988 [Tuber borchii]|uniref:Uncharacterized protein n=1 Tax=Tuber borchii TaxID=42251 RepID=A0A2T6ZI46_TUBBO|nr:hypothetical protein B9Z19DRAFT_1090988 [Tuber borchii]
MSHTSSLLPAVVQDLGDANFKSDICAHAPEAAPPLDLDTPLTISTTQTQSQPYFSFQYLQECENIWFERYRKRTAEIESEWCARWDELNRKRIEDSADTRRLTIMALHEKTETIKLLSNYNIRGALEHIVYHANLLKKIDHCFARVVQNGLNKIAKTPEFVALLNQEVLERRLETKDVTPCIRMVYDACIMKADGNDYVITLRKADHTATHLAVLAAFLKLQSGWLGGLEWREA